jgi:mRNA-degrading endonuclease RelE of RelBE toxin-antitoxin system
MKHSVRFPTHSIEKKFQKLLVAIPSQKVQDEIMEAIENLAGNPRPFGEPKLKPPLIVYQLTAQYRTRVRNFRILYDVDDKNRIVWILDLRKRNERTYS